MQAPAYHSHSDGFTLRLNKTTAHIPVMYVGLERRTWDVKLPYVTACNTAMQETTQATLYTLVYRRSPAMTIDATLPVVTDEADLSFASYFQRAEEGRQVAHRRIKNQHKAQKDRKLIELVRVYNQKKRRAGHGHKESSEHHERRLYNIRQRHKNSYPASVSKSRRRYHDGVLKKLLRHYFGPYKVLQRCGALGYKVVPDGLTSVQRRRARLQVLHVVRPKPY